MEAGREFAEAIEGRVVPSDYYGNANAWDNWFEEEPGHEEFVPDFGTVTLVDIEANQREDDKSMIFKVVTVDGDTFYFRKEGVYDRFWRTVDWMIGRPIEVVPGTASVVSWVEK